MRLGAPDHATPAAAAAVVVVRVTSAPGGWLVLAIRRRGGWALPGGYVEPGEAPAEAAVRETYEETGLEVAVDPEPLLRTPQVAIFLALTMRDASIRASSEGPVTWVPVDDVFAGPYGAEARAAIARILGPTRIVGA